MSRDGTMKPFDNYPSGLVVGFILAGIFGFIFDQIRDARTKMGQQNRTFNTFSDADQPNLTSSKVVAESQMGTIGCVVWTLVLFGAAYFLYYLAEDIRNFSF